MQNAKLTLDGGGNGTVKAPCPCESVDIICLTATFNFQFARRPDEAPILAVGGANASGVPDPSQANLGIGDAVAAAQISATYFEFKADGPRFKPWNTGDTIGFITGGGASSVIGIRPRRPGGS